MCLVLCRGGKGLKELLSALSFFGFLGCGGVGWLLMSVVSCV